MKFITSPLLLGLALTLASLAQIHAQTTAFTYQGRLMDAGQPANGSYDLLFQVFDAALVGSSVGGTLSTNGVPVSNGLFTVTLDFGSVPFNGANRWLQIQVSSNGVGSFTTLAPRQALTPTPRAIFANSAGTVTNGAITSAQLAASAVAAGNLQNNSVTAAKIASSQVVKSLNGLTDTVSLTQGANVTINTVGNSLQISAATASLSLPYIANVSAPDLALVQMINPGTGGAGLFGRGFAYGVQGEAAAGSSGNGVNGIGQGANTYGVYGVHNPSGNYGVVGLPLAGLFGASGGGQTYGTVGQSIHAVDGVGTLNETIGSRGLHQPTGNYGLLGASNAGVVGVSGSGTAIFGQSGGGSTAPQLRLLQTSLSDSCRLRLGIQDGEYWDIIADRLTPGQIGADLKFRWLGVTGTQITMHRNGNVSAAMFNTTSDRNAKENFSEVRPREVLEKVAALPVSRWNFKQDTSANHLGPMAQDFHAAFGLGSDDKHIATVDADGVALAAIQGLNEIVREKQAEIESLKSRLDKLEKLMETAAGGAR